MSQPILEIAQIDYVKKEAEKLNKELEKLLDETRTREKYNNMASLDAINGLTVKVDNIGKISMAN